MPHHLTLQSQITLPEPRWSSPSSKTTSLKVSNVGSSPSLNCDSLLSISNANSSQPSFIDTNVLKESCLGRVVLFYTKCRRVTPDIGRQADHLISVWSRPSSSALPVIGTESSRIAAEDGTRRKSQEKLNAILARAREANKHRVRKNAITIRQWELGSYTRRAGKR